LNANLLATLITLLAIAAIGVGILDRDLLLIIITNFLSLLAGQGIQKARETRPDAKPTTRLP